MINVMMKITHVVRVSGKYTSSQKGTFQRKARNGEIQAKI